MARLLGQAALVLAGTALLALSAKIQIPAGIVNISLQTLAILLLAALYGRTLAVLTLCAYLAEGIAGMPVFQGSTAGLAYVVGPTGGYLVGFVAMAAIVGYAADRGLRTSFGGMLLAMLAAEIVLLAFGAAWIALLLGVETAVTSGIGVFIVTDILKVTLAATIVSAISAIQTRYPPH